MATMLDYLQAYHTEQGFDLPRLFNDDYLRAVKLLYNNKHYVSAMKLLMSFVDTLGYLEFGDKPGGFQLWLNAYADLNKIGVSADELWELRNSLLHMTNLDSRKVNSGKVQRLVFYVGDPPSYFPHGGRRRQVPWGLAVHSMPCKRTRSILRIVQHGTDQVDPVL